MKHKKEEKHKKEHHKEEKHEKHHDKKHSHHEKETAVKPKMGKR